jgi:hypothetical protein
MYFCEASVPKQRYWAVLLPCLVLTCQTITVRNAVESTILLVIYNMSGTENYTYRVWREECIGLPANDVHVCYSLIAFLPSKLCLPALLSL